MGVWMEGKVGGGPGGRGSPAGILRRDIPSYGLAGTRQATTDLVFDPTSAFACWLTRHCVLLVAFPPLSIPLRPQYHGGKPTYIRAGSGIQRKAS